MIKISHIHDNGKVCVQSDRLYKLAGEYRIGVNSFYAGYRTYTGHWYAYDKTTGREIATFGNDFYETFIKRFLIAELERDENCIRVQ